jgi:hypothetical protein
MWGWRGEINYVVCLRMEIWGYKDLVRHARSSFSAEEQERQWFSGIFLSTLPENIRWLVRHTLLLKCGYTYLIFSSFLSYLSFFSSF